MEIQRSCFSSLNDCSGKFDENRDGTGRPNNGRHRALCRCLKCARVVVFLLALVHVII